MRAFARVLVLVAFVFVLGCSKPGMETYPVQGIVRFPDGKVLRGGSIEFECSNGERPVLATGLVGPDGTFVLGTRTKNDGAIAGQHRVAVFSSNRVGNGVERPGLIEKTKLDPKYRSFRTSGLTMQIAKETNVLVIEVDYASELLEDVEPD